MGIVGAGFIGPQHINAVRRLGFVDVVAVADMNEALAREKADHLVAIFPGAACPVAHWGTSTPARSAWSTSTSRRRSASLPGQA